jgi:CheY-like chemotaxis protein
MESGPEATILIVDDNEDIVTNLRMFLEFNNFKVMSAKNGDDALKQLHKCKTLPDVIVSDIMMPVMNGYELFKSVSMEPMLNQIPFIFLSAKATPDDVRLGRILGADDYLIKPFNQDDLLAILQGKIARKRRSSNLGKVLGNVLASVAAGECRDRDMPSTLNTYLLYVMWDDKIGPSIHDYYPKPSSMPFNVQEIGYQLFNASSAIYGEKFSANAEGILLSLVNLKQQAYIFFDSYPDRSKRAGVVLYMLAVVAPCISYLMSLNIKKVFEDLTSTIKAKKGEQLKKFQEKIVAILNTT